MNLKLKNLVLAAVAIVVGAIVLVGYFVSFLADLRVLLLRWAVILTGVLLLVGVVNLARVHWQKARTQQPGGLYSIILLLSLAITFVIGIFGPTKPGARWIFDYVQVPIESSLMAILAVILVYASARMLRRRLDFFSLVFVVTTFLVMIGTIALPGINLPFLQFGRNLITQIFAVAGARGILLGVGLGTVATGLRILMGADRPYGG